MITINLKNRCSSKKSLALFMQTNITHLKELEQTRTGETYATAFNSFMRFTNGEDVSLSEMDSDMMVAYETYLKVNGVSMNTISFYMRNFGLYTTVPWSKELLCNAILLSTSIQECVKLSSALFPSV